MSEPARNRFALDLDDLERQLRGAAQPQKPGSAVDPLQELTRLVGQDDPLKELFAGRGAALARPAVPETPVQAAVPWPPARIEPSFQPTLVTQAPTQPAAAPPAELRGALDEFEALLRRTEPVKPAAAAAAVEAGYAEADAAAAQAQPYAMQAETAQHAYVPEPPRDLDEAAAQGYPVGYDRPLPEDYAEPAMAEEDDRHYEQPRSRKGLWTAAALLFVAVGGVATAMVFRNTDPVGSNSRPPVISADNGPTKVAPTNPGGAEIPNQNKQIYERGGDNAVAPSADKTKIVSREEQPVDVQQATRSLPPRAASVMSGGGAAPIEPTATANANALAPAEPGLVPIPAVPGLGEPRRVRTVAIRPDGTPAPANGAATNGGPAVASTQGLVTGSAPAARPAATPSIAALPPVRPQPAAPDATPAAEPPKVQDRAAAPAAPPASATPPARTRTAALAPSQTTSPATAPAAAAPRTDANGGFAVQLGAPGSEAEARATFSALQRKYPDQLGGQSPIVRKTELAGGKTVYRLRVGPYSREDAATMCTALQAAGGQCFIAKN